MGRSPKYTTAYPHSLHAPTAPNTHLECEQQVPVCLWAPEGLELDLEVLRVSTEHLQAGAASLLKGSTHLRCCVCRVVVVQSMVFNTIKH